LKNRPLKQEQRIKITEIQIPKNSQNSENFKISCSNTGEGKGKGGKTEFLGPK